jgi:hypothetical protein
MPSRFMIRPILAAACLVIFPLAFGPPTYGEDHHVGTLTSLINPDLADYYKKNDEEIQKLVKSVKDTSRKEDERLTDFRKLRSKYPDPTLSTAVELVGDRSEKIAGFAVSVLGAAAVMSDHRMPEAVHQSPVDAYVMKKHEVARAALRKAQADERRDVRNRATRSLASLSDEIGLQNVVIGSQQGRYSEIEAVNHLGLAKREVSGKLIQPYLASRTLDAQAAAVSFLATAPNYQRQIRDEFLLNPKAPLESRLAAAAQLAQNPDIALLILGNAQTPPELFQETFLKYLRSRGPRFSAAQLDSFDAILTTYKKSNPDVEVKAVQKQLQVLKQANTP